MVQNKFFSFLLPSLLFCSSIAATEVFDQTHDFHPLRVNLEFYESNKVVFNLDGVDIKQNITSLRNPMYSIDQLAGEEITTEVLEQLKSLSTLIYELDLRETSLENHHLELLSSFDFNNLKKLHLSENNFDDNGLKYVSKFKNLTELSIVYNKVTHNGIFNILPITNLEFLNIGCTYIGDKGIEILSGMENIKKLDIRACNLNDDTLDFLLNMKKLEWVNLSDNNFSQGKLNTFLEIASRKNITVTNSPL